jgi:TatD DNase family protein
MASDAHAHPFDLAEHFPGAEEERRRLGIRCAASAWNREQFACHEALARATGARQAVAAPSVASPSMASPSVALPAMALCFGVHPQLPAETAAAGQTLGRGPEALALLTGLAAEGRLAAVGEAGFDLFDGKFRATEKVQDGLFTAQLEIALGYGLPMVLHVRRGMHKIFAHIRALKRLPAVVFHSYPGTLEEGESLLKRGVAAYFSFGTAILLNHKKALRACAALPVERLLLETDAPYQPLRGRPFSHWEDLLAVLAGAAALRREAGTKGGAVEELEVITDSNFSAVFGV